MTTKRLCGYDLNGWRDTAARNWILRPGENEEFGSLFQSESGLLPSVVHAGHGPSARWIGGPQAALAPHGRGEGWGEIGRRDRRLSVRQCIEAGARPTEAIAAALTGLVQGADHAVLAIDDLPATTERTQEGLLAALTATRVAARLLVWRPVLAALFAIERRIVAEDQTVGVICHSAEGFSMQTLRIRREQGHSSTVLAPERRRAGLLIKSRLGYRGLVESACNAVIACAKSARIQQGQVQAIGKLAFGQEVAHELLRLNNGDWEELIPPTSLDAPACDLTKAAFANLPECQTVLFETLVEGKLRASLHHCIAAILEQTLVELPSTAIAEGALAAANRIGPRDPVYFDFLPRISTIVQGLEGASNFDLIDADETLPAGRLYRSEKPARLGIQAGRERFSVYLRKEAADCPRRAVVELGSRLQETAPVDLWVEQAPAAGRAKILMEAPTLSRQFIVDWDAAEEIHKDWQAIIDEFAAPLPTVPNRLILPCGIAGWEDSDNGRGLSSLLEENDNQQQVDWDSLAGKLAQRPFGQYCISSDGLIPEEISPKDISRLGRLTERAVLELRNRLAGRIFDDNASLRFLTWQFKRCPEEIADLLLDSFEPRALSHPFITHPSHRVLFYQGFGRVAGSERYEDRGLKKLFEKPIGSWNWRVETACAAFLLSRSDTAPRLLSRAQVDLLAERVVSEFRANIGTNYTKFYYAPFLLVGLLRWRLKEPRALVVGVDPTATMMSIVVDKAITDIQRKVGRLPNLKRYIRILADARNELEGSGTNPDLLLDIYGAA